MLEKSSLKQAAKERTGARFNKLANKLNDRHEKLLGKKCTFKQMTQLNLGQVHIDYENTCQTISTVFTGNNSEFTLFLAQIMRHYYFF